MYYIVDTNLNVIEKSRSFDKLQDRVDADFEAGRFVVSEAELKAIKG